MPKVKETNDQVRERIKQLDENDLISTVEASIFCYMTFDQFKEIVIKHKVPFFPTGRTRRFRKSVIVNLRKELEVTA